MERLEDIPSVSLTSMIHAELDCESEYARAHVIAAAITGEAAYVALEWVMKDTGRRQVVGMVVLFLPSSDSLNDKVRMETFSEYMQPPIANCPEHILSLLTPTDDLRANKWRKCCIDMAHKCKVRNIT